MVVGSEVGSPRGENVKSGEGPDEQGLKEKSISRVLGNEGEAGAGKAEGAI